MVLKVPQNEEEVRALFPEADEGDVRPAGPLTEHVLDRVGELAGALDPDDELTIARDWEGRLFGVTGAHAPFDALAFTDHGRIAHGDRNDGRLTFFETLGELLDAQS